MNLIVSVVFIACPANSGWGGALLRVKTKQEIWFWMFETDFFNQNLRFLQQMLKNEVLADSTHLMILDIQKFERLFAALWRCCFCDLQTVQYWYFVQGQYSKF